jgi:putative inorganic carbon (HCO3(-)) transporter
VSKNRKRAPPVRFEQSPVGKLSFYLTLALLVLVPLALSPLVYAKYSLPKFVVLLVGSSLLFLLLTLERRKYSAAGRAPLNLFRSNLVRIVCLYFLALVLSTAFGVNPIGSLFGSSFGYMGLLTLVCVFIVFIALIHGASTSEKRLRAILLTIAGTGFFVAIYAVAQSFGIEPFVSPSTYTFSSPTGPLVRVCSTLGHPDYLGNFLLYTTLTTAALGVAERGLLRLLAIAATGISVAAIAFSGTRGSWIGMVAGVVVFAILELRNGSAKVLLTKRRLLAAAAGTVVLAGLVASSPAARSATARALSLMDEGVASSGRVLLWRDSLKMVSAFPIIGCGPEGFRKAFLAFKSRELAQLSPKANNESPHNAYLAAAISYGLAGAGLYVAMIVFALVFLMRARRQVREGPLRIVITGIVSSFAAVLVHNIFIFDQIATGLYFFAFLALAQVTNNVVEARKGESKSGRTTAQSDGKARVNQKSDASQMRPTGRGPLVVIVAGIGVVVSIWYSAGLIYSETAYKDLLNPANAVDYDGLVRLGDRVTSSPLPTGAYDYLLARVVDGFIRKLPAAAEQSQNSGVDVNAIRAQALRLATEHVEKSLADTFTPEMNYSLLGTLALAAGDVNKLQSAAIAAVNSDPNNYYTRWLMAEAYLMSGENERAAREAEIALDLYPASLEAASTLARARGLNPADDSAALAMLAEARNARPNLKRSAEELVEVGRKLSQAGKLKKARIKLVTAIGRANGPCADGHRELAIVYEKMGRDADAIAEWEEYMIQAPERASADQIKARLEALKQKSHPGQ